MADSLQFSAIFKLAISGAAAVSGDIKGIVGNLNEAYKAGQLTDEEFASLSKSALKAGQAMNTAGANTRKSAGGFIAAQIALQTVGQAATQAGRDLIKFGAAPFAVAAAFQDDFAQVARTSGLTGKALADLRVKLVDLSETTPVDFKGITEIASLGGQLGISGNSIATFTKTIVELKTASDLTGDAAGTAIARIATLTNLGQDGYQRLGSAIALAGVKSIATESQIVKTANTFASIGQQAGFTAPQIIGFSTALASLNIPPELARGTFQQFFVKLQQAVTGGGDALDTFAKTSGLTATQLSKDYNDGGAAGILVKFMKGLGEQGRTATDTLGDLGITSVRYVPTLEKLAQNVDVLTKSFKTANIGFDSNTELQRQYQIVSETTNQKIQELKNGFTAFLASIGSGSLPGLSTLVDGLTSFVHALNNLPQGAKAALTVVAALTAVAGAGLLIVGKFAQAAAAVLSLRLAFSGVGGAGGKAAAGIASEAAAADALTVSNVAAAASTEALAVASDTAGVKVAGIKGVISKIEELGVGGTFKSIGASIAGVGSSAVEATSGVLTVGLAVGGLAVAGIAAGLALSLNAQRLTNLRGAAEVAATGLDKYNAAIAANKQLSPTQITAGASIANNLIRTLPKQAAKSASTTQSLSFNSDTSSSASYLGTATYKAAQTAIKGTDKELASLVSSGNLKGAQAGLAALATSGVDIYKEFPKATVAVARYEAGVQLADGTNTNFVNSSGTIIVSAKNQVKALNALVKSYTNFATGAGAADDAQFGFGASVIAARNDVASIESANKSATTSALNLSKAYGDGSHDFNSFTSAGQSAHSALEAIAQAGNKATGALVSNGASAADISKSYQGTVGEVRKLGTQFGLSGDALNAFVAKYVASPKNLGYSVSVSGTGAAEAAIDNIARTRTAQIQVAVTSGAISAQAGKNALGYADGGYTGAGGKYQPAGVVHRGEYVVPKAHVNQATGLPYADALGRLARGSSASRGYASGGFVDGGNGVVELGPKSLQRLAGGVTQLILDSGAIAGAVNGQNARRAGRGGGR